MSRKNKREENFKFIFTSLKKTFKYSLSYDNDHELEKVKC